MVKHKHQKSKPTKKHHPPAKKQGKQVNISEFRAQLDVLDLKIMQVTADGNCLFRALADQLDGSEEEHEKYRNMVVQYIRSNREMFEPFIEDDASFEGYCISMEKDGTWAGHMELQAASLLTHSNICIHLHMSPRWYIRNFNNHGARMIHLSYHDGEHYNSVRAKDDPCDGPAKPVTLKADVNLTASSQAAKASSSHSKSKTSQQILYNGAINMVLAGSGCADVEKVEQVLQQVDGDVETAIEFLIALRESGESIYENGYLSDNENTGKDSKRDSDKLNQRHCDSAEIEDQLVESQRIIDAKSSSKPDKKIPGNKVCPCGSKKKYKSCCGTASGRTCSKDHEGSSKKGKRGKHGKKVAVVTKVPSAGLDRLPDMGALCI